MKKYHLWIIGELGCLLSMLLVSYFIVELACNYVRLNEHIFVKYTLLVIVWAIFSNTMLAWFHYGTSLEDKFRGPINKP